MILLVAALLPAIVLLVYVYREDRVEKEPMRLVLRIFFLGALAGPIAAIVESMVFAAFEAAIPAGVVLIILKFFIGVAAVEEGLKYLFLSTIRKNPEFNFIFDGIVYGVAVSLGFAALENVLYVFLMGGMDTAIQRAIFSVPGHCAYGVIMGCLFGVARQREVAGNAKEAKMYYWLAFLVPTIQHGFYDTALSLESGIMGLVALAVQITFIVAAMILVHKLSKTDQAIYPHGVQPPVSAQQVPAPMAQAQPMVQAQPMAQPAYQQPQMQPQPQQTAYPYQQYGQPPYQQVRSQPQPQTSYPQQGAQAQPQPQQAPYPYPQQAPATQSAYPQPQPSCPQQGMQPQPQAWPQQSQPQQPSYPQQGTQSQQ